MTNRTSIDPLREAIAERHNPYLLTVMADGRPHCVATTVSWDGDQLVTATGTKTATNAADRASVSLLWPPTEPGGYSLIVDGTATVAAGTPVGPSTAHIVPARAVLHRSGPPPSVPSSDCGSDCIPVFAA